MKRVLFLAVLTFGAALPLRAQADDPVEAATDARAWWRDAGEALAAHDTARALAALDSASLVWPTQPAHPAALVRLAVVARRPEAAMRGARRLLAIGLSLQVSHPAEALLQGVAGWAALADSLRAAGAPLARSTVFRTLDDTLFHPEGVAYDPATRRWFVSSIRERRVVAIDRAGAATPFVASGQDGLDAAFGMVVDRRRGVLWVASTAVPEEEGYDSASAGRAGLFAFDLTTGRLAARVALPPADSGDVIGRQVGDVALAPDGDLYASDPVGRAIYRVPAGEIPPVVEIVTAALLLRSPQGMAVAPDGRTMIVADYSHGLLRVDLRTRGVTYLPPPPGATLLGIDGLALATPGRLVAVQNGVMPARVVTIDLDRGWRRVVALSVADRPEWEGEPTLGTVTGGRFYYVAGSVWDNYEDG
ncbi:MAG TPA: hypothetical protein VFI13_04350, partial [Gemmatimonadales bacterium]|nr:hypothetical protein [Gemmatimonadales bacterium]